MQRLSRWGAVAKKIKRVLDRTISLIGNKLKMLAQSSNPEIKALIDEKDKLSHISELMKEGLAQAKQNREAQSAEQKNNTAEESKGGVEYSIQNVKHDNGTVYQNVVVLDTKIFNGVKLRNWGKVLTSFVYKNLAGKQISVTDNSGKNKTIEFARYNERVKKDGAQSSHRVIDKIARKKDLNSQLAVAHAVEIVQVMSNETESADNVHGWLDKNGWKYYEAILMKNDGTMLTATLNIANTRDGRNILYDINKIKEIGHGVVFSMKNNPQRNSHHNPDFEDSIPNSSENVKNDLSSENNKSQNTDSVLTSKQFIGWFGDWQNDPANASKVVNKDGTPLIMYHGTSTQNGNFYVFDSSKATKKGGLGFKALGSGNYFTSKALNGTERYGSRVIKAYLDIKNPYEFHGGNFRKEVCDALGLSEDISSDELQDEMRARGYDGVIQYDKNGEISIATTFDSEQIKSVDNIGTFDKTNPDIRYSKKKTTPIQAYWAENENGQKNNTAEAVASRKIVQSDINAAQALGRKSINSLNSAELKSVSAFAEKYWNELGVKSPFFRAWLGDWRWNDFTPIRVATKKGKTNSKALNSDTGWEINIPGKAKNETTKHKSKSATFAVPYLDYLEDIAQNAVLLESFGSDKGGDSLLMHSFYAVADIGNGNEVLKLYVQEMNNVNSDNTTKRTYMLQNITKQSGSSGSQNNSVSHVTPTAIKNVADLFAFVKQNDKNFSPTPASKVVNKDGTPLIMYHGTSTQNGEFYTFDYSKAKRKGAMGLRALGKGNYFTSRELDGTERYGSRVIKAYLDIKNPYEYSGGVSFKTEVCNSLGLNENISYDELQDEMRARGYDGVIQYDKNGEISIATTFDSEQIKSVDNIGTFDKTNPDIRFSRKNEETPIEAMFGFYSETIKENRGWQLLHSMLEIQTNSARKGIHFKGKDIENVARDIKNEYSCSLTLGEMKERLNVLYDYIANQGTLADEDMKRVNSVAAQVARGFLESSTSKDTVLWEQRFDVIDS